MIAIDTETNKLTWNSMEYKADLELTNTWHTGSFSDVDTESQFSFDRTHDDSFSFTKYRTQKIPKTFYRMSK